LRRATILQVILVPCHGHALTRPTCNHQIHVSKAVKIFYEIKEISPVSEKKVDKSAIMVKNSGN
jgi:hypothetical protein